MNNILVIDVEATCSDDKHWNRRNKPEIIEIGVCEIEASNLRVIPRDTFLVKNENTDITDYCTMLTGITQPDIDMRGIPFEHACERLKAKYNSQKKTWASFGIWDKKIIRRQCFEKEIDFPLGDQYYNVQHLMTMLLGLRNERSLTEALRLFGMEFEGRPHSGIDDAKNTGRLLVRLLEGNLPKNLKGS